MTEPNPEKQQLLRLADVARLANISRHTVQYYLLLGLLSETERTSGGHRLFDDAAVQRIKLIHQLNQSGYTLQEIRQTFLNRGS